jgi:hypothetical protein
MKRIISSSECMNWEILLCTYSVRDHVRNLSAQLYQQTSQMQAIFSHHLQQLAHNRTRTPSLQGSENVKQHFNIQQEWRVHVDWKHECTSLCLIPYLTVPYSLSGPCVYVKRTRTLYVEESSATAQIKTSPSDSEPCYWYRLQSTVK